MFLIIKCKEGYFEEAKEDIRNAFVRCGLSGLGLLREAVCILSPAKKSVLSDLAFSIFCIIFAAGRYKRFFHVR